MRPNLRPTVLTVALALGVASVTATASPTLLTYAPPNNSSPTGLSSGSSPVGVIALGTSNTYQLIDTSSSTNLPVSIGGNGAYGGVAGISAGGQFVSGDATAANGFSQAATYNAATGTWTALGGLGVNSTSVPTGGAVMQQSWSTAISADGSTVGGAAYYNAAGSGTSSTVHATIFRSGKVFDLGANLAGGNNTVTAVSGDGSLVAVNYSNTTASAIFQWNGSGYSQIASPTAVNPLNTGTAPNTNTGPQSISLNAMSANGVWAAGNSMNFLGHNYGTGGFFGTNYSFLPASLWNSTTNTGIVIPYDHALPTGGTYADIDLNMKAVVAGVSNNGVVIGTFNNGSNTGVLNWDAFIYNANGDGTSMSFDDYLASLGLTLTATQHVYLLTTMSADGTSIGGALFDTSTKTTSSFILDGLSISAVPEPATWALFGLALPLIVIGAKRQRKANCKANCKA